MEHPNPQPPPSPMHVVWPERAPFDGERTGFVCTPAKAGVFTSEELADLPPEIPLCKWEERFDVVQMHAILHMLAHLTSGLPGPLRRMVLRRADQFPKLHGHFAPYNGRLGFHAEEGEVIGMDACWHRYEDGTTERLW